MMHHLRHRLIPSAQSVIARQCTTQLFSRTATPAVLLSARAYSSRPTSSFSIHKDEQHPNVVVLTLHQSAFSYETAKEMVEKWKSIEKDESVRAVLLKSDLKSIFCAGIDFKEFMQGKEHFAQYWSTIRDVFEVMYGSRLNSASAIHGHALGLGCVLAMACQDRFMIHQLAGQKKGPTIGLNEVAVGVPVPEWLSHLFMLQTSQRAAEKCLPVGAILNTQQAAEIGLVDAVPGCEDQQQLDRFVIEHLAKRSKSPKIAQRETMKNVRGQFLETFRQSREKDLTSIVKYVHEEEAQAILKAAQAALVNKSKPKA
ncbi:dodecenoyl-CoA isomerase [Actinomortierella ambigua]|uniref:Dodecenoyl-CoA isomerase n=1 Tax=Actinomortierella ambigua TaxID=1343610 RepID=A0A9P6Q378_9FUNG|nr:dodecenoyl-CoA isomerase [Actinomortierella ambigua]